MRYDVFRPAVRTLIFLVTGIACFAAELPTPEEQTLAWFPLRVGNRWVYRHSETTQSGVSGKVTVIWTSEERVREQRRVSQGLLVLMEETQRAGSGGPAPPQLHRDYLIRGGDVYEVFEHQWLPGHSDIKPLDLAQSAPLFRFPLRTGSKWAEPDVKRDDNMYCWFVESQAGNTYRLVNMTMPDRVDVSFRRGVGVIRRDYIHHGTLDDLTTRLLRFIPR